MFDWVQPTPAASAAATNHPRQGPPFIANTTIPWLCTAQQQKYNQHLQHRQPRKGETKSDRRLRASSSLPNCALPRESRTKDERHHGPTAALGQVASVTTTIAHISRNQQQQQQLHKVVDKSKSRHHEQQRQQPNTQHMAFFGTVRETVEFLRGTIGRSRRKGADLATGGRDLASQRGESRANGVCPVPDANGPSACTSSGQKKAVLIPSFSQTGSAQSTRKVVQSVDNCVADSVDDQMLDKLCTLPKGLDRHEWLASHVLALFEHVNCISATLSEVCTPISCSTMSFPGNSKAQWVDERGKRHNYSAMRYIDSVMALCEGYRKNQQLFPTKYGATFAVEFEQHCTRMVRLLWHCAGHAYAKHWEHLNTLNLRLQFGLVLAHMAKLAKLYSLLSDKELGSLLHTLQLARPSIPTTVATPATTDTSDCCNESQPTVTTNAATTAAFVQQPQHRPTKRALLEDNNDYTTGASTAATDVLVCRTNTSF